MEEAPAQMKLQPLKVLWMAFVGTVAIYIVIAYLLGWEREPASDLSFMLPIASVAAAVVTSFAFLGGKLFAQMEYQSYCIVRWAMAESVGILGLLLVVLGSAKNTALAFFVWSLLSFLRLRPTPEDYLQYLRLRDGKK
ncbi:MAG: hypothetical protein FJ147_07255 [Deltaproteobacteria bacterium]|nr:hypothetical protein [Deltaproteobacteria bacterium]